MGHIQGNISKSYRVRKHETKSKSRLEQITDDEMLEYENNLKRKNYFKK